MEKDFTGQGGIVLYPDGTADRTARLSLRSIARNKVSFKEGNIPHVSLYHAWLEGVPLDSIQQQLNVLERMRHLNSILLISKSMSFVGGHFIFWEFEKTEVLISLHKSTLATLSPYFSTPETDVKKEELVLPQVEADNIKQYGQPFVNEQWNPHITVGYCDSLQKIVLPEVPLGVYACTSFAFVSIGIYGMIEDVILPREKGGRSL